MPTIITIVSTRRRCAPRTLKFSVRVVYHDLNIRTRPAGCSFIIMTGATPFLLAGLQRDTVRFIDTLRRNGEVIGPVGLGADVRIIETANSRESPERAVASVAYRCGSQRLTVLEGGKWVGVADITPSLCKRDPWTLACAVEVRRVAWIPVAVSVHTRRTRVSGTMQKLV